MADLAVFDGKVFAAGCDSVPGPRDHDFRWRIEERDTRTGELSATFSADPSTARDRVQALAVGPFGLLAAGVDESTLTDADPVDLQWRIERSRY